MLAAAAQPKTTTSATVAAQVDAPVVVDNSGWEKQYGYIFGDLRKLGIVSLALFAAIIVLGFFF